MLSQLTRKLTKKSRKGSFLDSKSEHQDLAANPAVLDPVPFHQQDWTQLSVVKDSGILEHMSQREVQRQQIVHELLLTEQQFCRDLFTVQWIHKELMTSKTLWEPVSQFHQESANRKQATAVNEKQKQELEVRLAQQKAEFDQVFADIWPLIGLHEHFRDVLQQAYRKSPVYPACVKSCKELAEKVLPLFLQPYEDYCVHYSERMTSLQKLMKDNLRFKRQLIQVVSDRGRGWTVEVLLHKPMQRLSQYHLLFEKLRQMTPEDDEDYAAAVKMTTMLQTILKHLDGLKANLEVMERLKSFEREMSFKHAVTVDGRRKKCKVGREYRLTLPENSSRRCVRQQLFHRAAEQKKADSPPKLVQRRLSIGKRQPKPSESVPTMEPIQLFLLTDYLLIGRPVTNTERKKYPYIKWMMLHLPIPLADVSVREMPGVLELTAGKEVYVLHPPNSNSECLSSFCSDLMHCASTKAADVAVETKLVQPRPLSVTASSFTSKLLRRSSLIEAPSQDDCIRKFVESEAELDHELLCKVYYWSADQTPAKWIPLSNCRIAVYGMTPMDTCPTISILEVVKAGLVCVFAPEQDQPLFICKLSTKSRIHYEPDPKDPKSELYNKDFRVTMSMFQYSMESASSEQIFASRPVVLRIKNREQALQLQQSVEEYMNTKHDHESMFLPTSNHFQSAVNANDVLIEEVHRSSFDNEKKPIIIKNDVTCLDDIALEVHVDETPERVVHAVMKPTAQSTPDSHVHVVKLGESRHVYDISHNIMSNIVDDIIDNSIESLQMDSLVFSDEDDAHSHHKSERNETESVVRFQQKDYDLLIDDKEETIPLLPGRDSSLCEPEEEPQTADAAGGTTLNPFDMTQIQLWVDAAIDDASALYEQLESANSLARYQVPDIENGPSKLAHHVGFELMQQVMSILDVKGSCKDQDPLVQEQYQSAMETGKATLNLLRSEMDRMYRQVGRLETLLMEQHHGRTDTSHQL